MASFTPNPFDQTGEVDTEDQQADSKGNPQSAASVTQAFTDSNLASDAANRAQETESQQNRTP